MNFEATSLKCVKLCFKFIEVAASAALHRSHEMPNRSAALADTFCAHRLWRPERFRAIILLF